MESMTLPGAVQAIWDQMESIREQVLDEANGLRQAQADWRAGPGEWSIGEILHHLIVAEIQTGKLTAKLVREGEAAGTLTPYPSDMARFEPLPARDADGMQAPASVLPEPGRSLVQLLAELRAIRTRSRESVDKLARPPRPAAPGVPSLRPRRSPSRAVVDVAGRARPDSPTRDSSCEGLARLSGGVR